ncbi:hypothetical protein AYI68_g1257 [Smittium mucronatum]|uniref:Uncharacterized protein n=1 Tax=Smittium mucronatum TaxID=133383 RepID=A0A1R0H606_9FUNG|nr:hypothetical protein AYI68_g1257 [Smittium mucronatum]
MKVLPLFKCSSFPNYTFHLSFTFRYLSLHEYSSTPGFKAPKKSIASDHRISRPKIRYTLSSNHNGFLDADTKLYKFPSFKARSKDRDLRRLRTQHNRFLKFVKDDPSLLDFSLELGHSPYAKIFTSGLRLCAYTLQVYPRDLLIRLRRSLVDYPGTTNKYALNYVMVVDETRTNTRYGGKSTYVLCNSAVLRAYLLENKTRVQNTLGKIRSDFIQHVEKTIKIRIITELAILLDTPIKKRSEKPPVYLSTLDSISPVSINSIPEKKLFGKSKFDSLFVFEDVSLDFMDKSKKIDLENLPNLFSGPNALNTKVMLDIYNSIPSENFELPVNRDNFTGLSSQFDKVSSEISLLSPNHLSLTNFFVSLENPTYLNINVDRLFGSGIAKLILFRILSSLDCSICTTLPDSNLFGASTFTLSSHQSTREVFVQLFKLRNFDI